MARNLSSHLPLFFFFIILITRASGQNASTSSRTFALVNKCKETIWPGIISTGGNNHSGDGFALKSDQTFLYHAPAGWSGRIWARTGCNFDQNGTGTCQTGSCGASLNCSRPSVPPNTIAEFTLGEPDFYDVSLVNGFNLPIVITPLKKNGSCRVAGCDGDLRDNCLKELAVQSDGKVIACRSACDVFNTDEYCCRGTYADPVACVPTNYSKSFKQVCPTASSYALDDQVITCSASDYVVSFCTSRNQTVCSYHDNKLVCNTSNGSKAASPKGLWILMLTLPLILILQIKF